MGDISEMMLDGTLCECCGILMISEGEESCGYPIRCEACQGDEDLEGLGQVTHTQLLRPFKPKTEECHLCKRKFAGTNSLRQHMRDRHGETAK